MKFLAIQQIYKINKKINNNRKLIRKKLKNKMKKGYNQYMKVFFNLKFILLILFIALKQEEK